MNYPTERVGQKLIQKKVKRTIKCQIGYKKDPKTEKRNKK